MTWSTSDPEVPGRTDLISLLGMHSGPALAETFLACLRDPDAAVRDAVVRQIGAPYDPRTPPALSCRQELAPLGSGQRGLMTEGNGE